MLIVSVVKYRILLSSQLQILQLIVSSMFPFIISAHG